MAKWLPWRLAINHYFIQETICWVIYLLSGYQYKTNLFFVSISADVSHFEFQKLVLKSFRRKKLGNWLLVVNQFNTHKQNKQKHS